MERNKDAMACAMNFACSQHPHSNQTGEYRKWLTADGQYRQLTLNSALAEVDNEYSGSTGYYRPKVSKQTKDHVFEALMDFKAATSKEIADHETTDRGRRQIQNALEEYEEQGVIDWTKSGRKYYYYISDCEEFIPEEKREEIGVEVPLEDQP